MDVVQRESISASADHGGIPKMEIARDLLPSIPSEPVNYLLPAADTSPSGSLDSADVRGSTSGTTRAVEPDHRQPRRNLTTPSHGEAAPSQTGKSKGD